MEVGGGVLGTVRREVGGWVSVETVSWSHGGSVNSNELDVVTISFGEGGDNTQGGEGAE